MNNIILICLTVILVPNSLVNCYIYEKGNTVELSHCPGIYCGRQKIENGNSSLWSPCGACPRGSRVDKHGECAECNSSPTTYDWMYLCFMVLIGLLVQWYSIDSITSDSEFTFRTLCIHISALIETILAAVVSLLVSPPVGSFNLKSCKVHRMSDWYTMMHNPNPNYEETLHCSQEAVYPLYSIVFIHYGMCIIMLLMIRPLVNKTFKINGHTASKSIYAALYFFPMLGLLHGIMAGVIYYSFPSITILLSLLSHAFHFASREDQSWQKLLQESVSSVHNSIVVVGHWLLHAYGIIALTMWLQPEILIILLIFVPLPTVLYVVFSKFTDPVKFHNE